MKPTLWFRAAAIALFLFAAGHTYGFLTFRPATTEGQAVWQAMNSVHFSAGRSTFSYGDFYLGFGLFVSLFMLFSAWLAWHLGSLATQASSDARRIAWAMVAVQIVNLILSLRYFAAPPAAFSALTALFLALGALSL